MARIVDVKNSDDLRDLIHQTVQHVVRGDLVGLPTDTVYVAAAYGRSEEAVRRLLQVRSAPGPSFLVVKDGQEALDYVPQMSRMGRKLVWRCWPGPVGIAFHSNSDVGAFNALSPDVVQAVSRQGEVYLRAAGHSLIQEILKLIPGPLVVSGDRHADRVGPTSGQAASEAFGEAVEVVLDAGDTWYLGPASVVRVAGDSWNLVESGVVNELSLRRLASEIYLFVCTGNTCRSPLAEGLFRKLLAERIKCSDDELYDRGHIAVSAGLSASRGAAASPESIQVAAREGVDPNTHASQPLTDQLLNQADYIFPMTRQHRDTILAARPDVADRVQLLSRDQQDVPDPIGGGPEEYEECKRQIERAIRSILDELPI